MYKYKCQRCGNIQNSIDPPQTIHICNECNRVDIPLYAIDLYDHVDIPYVIRILESERQRREYDDPIGIIYYWKTKDDNIIKINDMSNTHLENTIQMLKRKINV